MRDSLRALGSVVAPVTLVTALLYYFGRVSTAAQYGQFGIPQSALRLSTTDYLLQSANPMVTPLLVLTLAALTGILGHSVLAHVFREPGRRTRIVLPAVVGLAGLAIFLQGIGGPMPILRALWPYRSLLPFLYRALGIVLIAYAVHLSHRLLVQAGRRSIWAGESSWALPVLLLLAGFLAVFFVFIAVAQYAGDYGRAGADRLVGELKSRPAVTVYSPRQLSIHPQGGVHEHAARGPDAQYRYCYGGLRLLAWENGKVFLLPDEWPQNQVTIILPESGELRIELARGDGQPADRCGVG